MSSTVSLQVIDMKKQKLKNLIIVAVFIASIIPLGFAVYKSVTLNLSWNYSEEKGFMVYSDPEHLFPYADQENIDLGSFDSSSSAQVLTFYVVNDGQTQIEIVPNWYGTNITGAFDTTNMILGIGAEAVVNFTYTVEGTGQAQVWFDTPP